MATSDCGGKVLHNYAYVINNTWTIDSSVTINTTFDSIQISSLGHSSQKFISTANGNTTLVIGEGSLTLTDTLNLDFVLVVPSLNYNILSVYQIIVTLSCIIIFWLEFCVFNDIQARQTIGYGIKRGKLSYLDLRSKDSNKLQQALITCGSQREKRSLKFGYGINDWDMLPLVI